MEDGEIRDLGSLEGNLSAAVAINNRSQIIGISANAIPDPFSFAGVGTQVRGILWEHGEMRDLGTLGGPDTNAFGLNERGQVAGNSYINSTPNPITGLPTSDPFLWTEDRGMIDLGTLGGVWGGAGLLNNQGQVLGTSSLAADPAACLGIGNTANCHPFVWDDGKLTDLNTETIGGNPITANALNDAGGIIGAAAFPNAPYDAYLWKNGVARDLGAVDDDCFSEAFVVNSRDQIAGLSIPCAVNFLRAFLWENGSMVDLNAVSSPGNLNLIDIDSINNRGEIGGVGVPPGCSQFTDDKCGHAYVLIPVCTDGNEGCADAPLDPAIISKSRAASRAAPKTMTAEELATLKERIARMTGRNRGFKLWARR